MPDLKEHIQDFFKNYKSSELIVACSGGVDSMVLLWLAKEFHPKVHVAHVNYQLRGEDSEMDEELVRDFCQKNDLKLSVRKIDMKTILERDKGNLQDLARKLRYKFFNQLSEGKDSVVALGQHSDDQVETFFLNLARGGSIAGLAAIHEVNGKFLRPLLNFSRDEIKEFAIGNNITWREDRSNSDSKYNRNKLRNIILPELYKALPNLKESVIILTNAFQKTQKELESKIQPVAISILEKEALAFHIFDQFNDFEIVELLRQIDVPVSYLEEVQKLRGSEKGRYIELANSPLTKIIREEDHFYLGREKPNSSRVQLNKLEVASLPLTFSKDEIYLDPEKIKGELFIRIWKIGDRISPVGLNGSKLISDVLTDAKIPNHIRKEILVVCDEEKVLWCPGYSVGRDALASSDSKKLKLSLSFD